MIFSIALIVALAQTPTAPPQTAKPLPEGGFPGLPANHTPKVEIAWNRLYDTDHLYELFDRLAATYPALMRKEVIGHSTENREMRVYVLTNAATGADTTKPAMWI
ncbi:MAG TPA: M14 family zinc carboxypeptidase, partial [Planctomycetota bacterium]|nr:M14 family zinc carboxypeptidase [Planctomycetota bacterium]